ncbi:MAG: hypothetical protein R6V62_08630 [Candidatus Fermentibacteraceae bacterium]
MPALLLVAVLSYSPPSVMGRGVHPAAWASSPLELFDAPAGLSRLEGPEAGGWVRSFSDGPGEMGVYGGIPLPGDRFSAGAVVSAATDIDDFEFALGGSWVVTGDPIGFMEGLFGPSIVLGCSGGAVDTGEGFDPFVTASLQFSMFPSFALGAASSWSPDARPRMSLGFTHVFNRAFTLNAGFTRESPEIGALLRISPDLSFTAGTGGRDWHSGVLLHAGPFRIDLSVVFDGDDAEGGAGLSWRL